MTTNYHIEHFDNIAELIDTCDARAYNPWAQQRRTECKSWAGDGYTQARELLQAGCSADVKKIKPRRLPHVADVKPRNVNSVIGYAPIVPAAIMNVPTCMINRQAVEARNKVIHLIYDVDVSANVRKSQMIEQGKRVAAFILSAEQAGYSIQLDAFSAFQRHEDTDKYAMTLTLKDASRPLDLKRLTYPLLHVSMLRQICFDWYERLPHAQEVFYYGLPLYHESEEYRKEFLDRFSRGEVK